MATNSLCQLALAVFEQRAFVVGEARAGHQVGATDLAPPGVRNADDGHLGHLGVGQQHFFDFGGEDVLAAGDEYFLG